MSSPRRIERAELKNNHLMSPTNPQSNGATTDDRPVVNGKGGDDNNNNNGKQRRTKGTPMWVYGALVSFAVISYVTLPNPLQPHHGEEPSIQHVFYYGWLTAISTGLGAIPLMFAPNLASYWVGISNGRCNDNSWQNISSCLVLQFP